MYKWISVNDKESVSLDLKYIKAILKRESNSMKTGLRHSSRVAME